MRSHIEGRLIWQPVSEYQNTGTGVTVSDEPEVLLWHSRFGTALGKVLRWSDGEVITIGGGTGFTYTHFALLDTPDELAKHMGVTL